MRGRVAVMPVVVIMLAVAVDVAARCCRWQGSGGWGPAGGYGRMYDSSTVETITGEVTSVEYVSPMKGMSQGVHLLVKTDKETVAVHLGPAWFVENQDVKIEPKDRVEVKGSRVVIGGNAVIIAAEVQKGDEALLLRDDTGTPVWSGWRRRGTRRR